MSKDGIFWCFSQANGYFTNTATNIKGRMKDCTTVRGTKPGQPRWSCCRGTLKGCQPLSEDPHISRGGKTMGVDHTSLHTTVPQSLTALCRPQQGRGPFSMHQSTQRKEGNHGRLCCGLCWSSPVPTSCVLVRRQLKVKFTNTAGIFSSPSKFST